MVRVNIAPEASQLPPGVYHFAVTDGEVRETSQDSKHPETDYWSLELTVQDGEQEGRKQFLSVMLPPYETYTLSNLLRATVGQHRWSEDQLAAEEEVDVELDDLIGLEFVASVRPQKNNADYNEVRRIRPYDADQWGEADLLPG